GPPRQRTRRALCPQHDQAPMKPPRLHTERLVLRAITVNDVDDIFEYASDPEVTQYVRFVTHKTKRESRAFVARMQKSYAKGVFVWGIELKAEKKMIGSLGFVYWEREHRRAELGYVIGRKYWGKGLTTEAVRPVVEYAFQKMKLIRLEAGTIVENVPSQRILEKVGFQLEGTFRKKEFIKGEFPDQ